MIYMKTIVEILESLEADNSRLVKEAILKQNSNNELLTSVFLASFDPYVNYGVIKFKMPKAIVHEQDVLEISNDGIIDQFLSLLRRLNDRELTGNSARYAIEEKFGEMTNVEQKWCHRILLKNLRCGVQASTVNKIWADLIPEFNVSLANTLKTSGVNGQFTIEECINYPVFCDPKLDGFRCVVIKRMGEVTVHSRNGKIVETIPTITNAIKNCGIDDFVLDCEIMGSSWDETAEVINSRKNKKSDASMVLHVFDFVPFDDWQAQCSNTTYSERRISVLNVVTLLENDQIKQTGGVIVNDENELREFYARCLNEGYEGVMLKDLSAKYEFKRSNAILKLKPVSTWEGIITGWYEGRENTRREGGFGGFNVTLPNGVVTQVGNGWDDKTRVQINEHPNAYLGKFIEVEGQPDPLTENGLTKDGKIRFPVFSRYRDDADVSNELLNLKRSLYEL